MRQHPEPDPEMGCWNSYGRGSTQHYRFAHRILPQFFFGSKTVLVEFLPLAERLKILQRMWDECYDPKLGEPAIPNDGLVITPFNITDQYPCVLITLPEPSASPEAYYIALVPGNFIIAPDASDSPVMGLRAISGKGHDKNPSWGVFEREIKSLYVTLEKGEEDGQTFLCEWKESGAHYNYGEGPSPDKDAFIQFLIERIFQGDEFEMENRWRPYPHDRRCRSTPLL